MKQLALALALVFAAAAASACSSKAQGPSGEAPSPPRTAEPVAPTPSRVVTETFHSDALGVDKAVVVYLPRGYDSQPARRWPVFYYLHGLGGNETNWVHSGKLDATADQVGLAAIVVMPDGDDGFYVDSPRADRLRRVHEGRQRPVRPRARAARHDVRPRAQLRDLHRQGPGRLGRRPLPHDRAPRRPRHRRPVDGRVRRHGAVAAPPRRVRRRRQPLGRDRAAVPRAAAVRARQDRAVHRRGGLGRQAGAIGAWIRRLFGDDIADWKAHDVVELAGKPGAGKVALYFDCGTEDDFALQDNVQYVHEALGARHIAHEFFLGPGKHDFGFWSARLPVSLAFLRDHTAKPE